MVELGLRLHEEGDKRGKELLEQATDEDDYRERWHSQLRM